MTSRPCGVTVGLSLGAWDWFSWKCDCGGKLDAGKLKSRLIVADRKTWATDSGGAVEGEGRVGETSATPRGGCSLGRMLA